MSAREKLSLLMVSHSYPPVLGGSEVELQRVCQALQRRGHQVRVLCAGGPPMPDLKFWVDPVGVNVQIIGRGSVRWRDFRFAVGVAWVLWRQRSRYDAVYFLMQGLHLASGLPVARSRNYPVVMKFSGSSIITMLQKSWLGRLEISMLRRWAKRIMVLNDGMTTEALHAGMRPERLVWMPNPVDTAEFAPVDAAERVGLRRSLSIPQSAKVILFVGRLAPEKELGGLLRAFARVTVEGAQLILVGDGPEMQSLQSSARQLGLSDTQVRFTGRVPVQTVPQWLAASDVFALVSSVEGFPCSLLEAMSSSVASVVSDIPANRQLIVDGENGLIVPQGDESAMCDALGRLLMDADLRLQLGIQARNDIAGKYSMDQIAARYEAVFEELLHP